MSDRDVVIGHGGPNQGPYLAPLIRGDFSSAFACIYQSGSAA
jgi:hypothetical protein